MKSGNARRKIDDQPKPAEDIPANEYVMRFRKRWKPRNVKVELQSRDEQYDAVKVGGDWLPSGFLDGLGANGFESQLMSEAKPDNERFQRVEAMTDLKTIAAECATRIMDRMEMCRGSAILKGDIEREVELALAQYDPLIRQSVEVDWGPDVGREIDLGSVPVTEVIALTTFEDWHAYGEAKRRGEVLGYPDLSIIADLDNAVPYKPLISDDLWKSINEALKANNWRWAAERFGPGPAYVDLPECASGVIGATHKVKTPE